LLLNKKTRVILKDWIKYGQFLLTEPVAPLRGPEAGVTIKALRERPLGEAK
jgi:hypothetical protein